MTIYHQPSTAFFSKVFQYFIIKLKWTYIEKKTTNPNIFFHKISVSNVFAFIKLSK